MIAWIVAASLTLPAAAGQEPTAPPAQDPHHAIHELELGGEDRAPETSVRWDSTFDGTLFVRVDAPATARVRLELENESGEVHRAQETGGAPCASRSVHDGRTIVVRVAVQPDTRAVVRLHLVGAPETDATREAANWVPEAIGEARRALADGDPESANEAAAALWRELEALDGFARSALLAPVLRNLLDLAFNLGDLNVAARVAETLLERNSRWFPAGHAAVVDAMRMLGLVEYDRGRLDRALELEERVVELREGELDALDRELLEMRFNLARTKLQLGRVDEALRDFVSVVEGFETLYSPDSEELEIALTGLGMALRRAGRLYESRTIHERVVEILAARRTEGDLGLARARFNLAGLHYDMGDFDAALALRQRVLPVFERLMPFDHHELQTARASLAASLSTAGRVDEAREMERTVVEAFERSLGPDHPSLFGARLNFAQALLRADPAQAQAELEDIVEAFHRAGLSAHPTLRLAEASLADALDAQGLHERSILLRERTLAAQSENLPADHLRVIRERSGLTWSLFRAGRREAATNAARENAGAIMSAVGRARRLFAPRDVETIVLDLEEPCALLLALTLEAEDESVCRELERESFEMLEGLRGAALSSAALLRSSSSGSTSSVHRAHALEASQEVSALIARDAGPSKVLEAVRKRDLAYRALLAELGARSGEGGLPITVLAERLGADTALIAYRAWPRPRRDGTWIPFLAAFVVDPGGSPHAVDLGPLAPIIGHVREWRSEQVGDGGPERGVNVDTDARGADVQLSTAGNALRAAVLDPLRHYLGDARRIVVVPDDALHLVPFDALPANAEAADTLVGEQWRIDTRATVWELLSPPAKHATDQRLVLAGGIDYGSGGDSAPESVALRGLALRGSRAIPFALLPGTLAEVRGIAAVAGEAGIEDAVVVTGEDATWSKLTELSPNATVLHLATHGWFAEPETRTAGADSPFPETVGTASLAPASLCGLALAGANRRVGARGEERGVISAEELAALDLARCELAVLSACDTNVGVRRAGQGVASLQKGLQMAGAQTVVTSLWKVPDEATKDLMVDFYRRIWLEDAPPWRALRDAKARLRAARDAEGRPAYTTRDWAGWVLTGEPE